MGASPGSNLQSLVPALEAAVSFVAQPPAAPAPSPATSAATSIVVIDGTAIVNGSSLWPLTADVALRVRWVFRTFRMGWIWIRMH